jgi:hypothetical protein
MRWGAAGRHDRPTNQPARKAKAAAATKAINQTQGSRGRERSGLWCPFVPAGIGTLSLWKTCNGSRLSVSGED